MNIRCLFDKILYYTVCKGLKQQQMHCRVYVVLNMAIKLVSIAQCETVHQSIFTLIVNPYIALSFLSFFWILTELMII